jgi:hypothetical protein
VEGLCYLLIGTKAFTVHLLVIDPSQPFTQLPENYGEPSFLRALSSLQLSDEVGRPSCFTASFVKTSVSASCEFLVGLETNSFIRVSYPVVDLELKLSSAKISVVKPPKSLVKAFSSLFRSTEDTDSIVSIACLPSNLVTLNSSGVLRIWSNVLRASVLAEAAVGDQPTIYKCVAKAVDAGVKVAIAYECSGSQCVSVHSYSALGLQVVAVFCAPHSSSFFDCDLNNSCLAVVWQTFNKVEVACYSFHEAVSSKVLSAVEEDGEDYRLLGVTCTEGFVALIRENYVGLLRRPVSPLEGMSWHAESVSKRFADFTHSADVETLKQLRIETQGSQLACLLGLVRLWRPRLMEEEAVELYIDRVRACYLPYHIAMVLKEALPDTATLLTLLEQLRSLLDNSPRVTLDESPSVWPVSVIQLLSQALISLACSLTELALDLLVLVHLTQDKAELFREMPFLQDFTATAESCVAIYRGLSCKPKGYQAAPAVTAVLAERSAALIGFTEFVNVFSFTDWVEATLASIFQHLKVLLPISNNCGTPTLLELLATTGQAEAVHSMLNVLPPCYAGLEFEAALFNRTGIDRVSVLADSLTEAGHQEFLTGRWWRLALNQPELHNDSLSLKLLSLVSSSERISRSAAYEAAQTLAYLAQLYTENQGLICDIYHNFIKLGCLKSAFAILLVMPEASEHISTLAQALFETGKLHEVPWAQTSLRSELMESVRELAANEHFSLDGPLQCVRYAEDAAIIFGPNIKPIRPFLGYHDLLYALELQTGQFSAAAASMYSYACKIEHALRIEGYRSQAEDFCKRLQRDALLCASVALNSSKEDWFVTSAMTRRSELKRTVEGRAVEAFGSEAEHLLVTRADLQFKLASLLRA